MNISLSKKSLDRVTTEAMNRFIENQVKDVGNKIVNNVQVSFRALKKSINKATRGMGANEKLNFLHSLYQKSVANDGLALPEFVEQCKSERMGNAVQHTGSVTQAVKHQTTSSVSATRVAEKESTQKQSSAEQGMQAEL